jgi:hypothetical protein
MAGKRVRALAGATVLVLGVAACGDDSDEETTDTTVAAEATTTTAADDETTTTEAAAEGGDEGEEGGDAPDVNPCAEGESGELAPATPPAAGATEVAVSATEYRFDGLDAMSATGEYAVTLTNEGQELHELIVVRLADEETPLEELIASDEEPEMTEIAFTFACPGATADVTAANLDQPGRYVAVCFIPVGTTPETAPEDFETLGPPHAAQGMAQEFFIQA